MDTSCFHQWSGALCWLTRTTSCRTTFWARAATAQYIWVYTGKLLGAPEQMTGLCSRPRRGHARTHTTWSAGAWCNIDAYSIRDAPMPCADGICTSPVGSSFVHSRACRLACALHRPTRELVAIKLLPRGDKCDQRVKRELRVNLRLCHPHIVRFRQLFLTDTHLVSSICFFGLSLQGQGGYRCFDAGGESSHSPISRDRTLFWFSSK